MAEIVPVPEEAVEQVYVQPGESHLLQKPALIRTVLGSCVGITFWSERLGIGALCHPMLPRAPASTMYVGEGRRYVDFAIEEMARQIDRLGILRNELQVKLFGGGDVLPVSEAATRATVGRLNIEAAIEVTEREGLSVLASSLGGNCGIHIQFDTRNGEVQLRRLC
jgi:chemotaxis protein CheD